MVTKQSSKTVAKSTPKKPVKAATKPKIVPVPANASEIADFQKIIDMQAKQLLQLNKSVGALQSELKEIKDQITSAAAGSRKTAAAEKEVPAKTVVKKAKAPVKKAPRVVAKPAPKKPVKAVKTQEAPQTEEPVKHIPAKRGRKLVQPALDTMVPVPVSISERLNALTAKKKITQTQFAEEVDLPPNFIFDISAQKVKNISFERIQKITIALKKYETK
jgi:DNA-binding Xre family transcriptional regulator